TARAISAKEDVPWGQPDIERIGIAQTGSSNAKKSNTLTRRGSCESRSNIWHAVILPTHTKVQCEGWQDFPIILHKDRCFVLNLLTKLPTLRVVVFPFAVGDIVGVVNPVELCG